MSTPSGVGFESRSPITDAETQAVLNAAAVLQLRRTELAAALTEGPVRGAEIAAHGLVAINRWMMAVAHTWTDLLSVRPTGATEQLRISLPNNRVAVENGLRMTSVFDFHGLSDAGRALLAAERHGTYLLGIATVQMKIIDRRFALLHGPTIDGQPTVMTVREPHCLSAAWEYWHRIMDSAYPVADHPATFGRELSLRQRQILALLAADTSDDAIASSLGVSVRTVRADIAEALRVLGVRSRFAAGIRLQEIAEATG